MRTIESVGHTRFNDLLDKLRKMGNRLILVRASGEDFILFANGKVLRQFSERELLKDVEIFELDKFEFLDYLEQGDKTKNTAQYPKSVEFKCLIDCPSELKIKLESAVRKAVLKAYKQLDVAVENTQLKASIRYGATGRDILLVSGSLKAYSTKDVEKEELVKILNKVISEETGFYTRVHIRDFELVKTLKKPVFKVSAASLPHFRGGRVVEIRFAEKKSRIPLKKSRIEEEVERMLAQSEVDELRKILKTEKRTAPDGKVERIVWDNLSSIKGLRLNWMRVLPDTDGGLSVAIGISRKSRSLSEGQIINLIKSSLKNAEKTWRTRGLPSRISSAMVVFEEDIY
ncbi:hypothetical protein [Thermococcus thioreducens]|uniref:Uncharacterized protein n=1 Tax=Thermococcus thioreducens TaxID=277988 RepID=A0A0Q2UQU3_9EURY|nr:hypothetical protein [Thermococcus thioreducens]ASJ12308.1 hypothetical protein A3L14_05120 [Thermococcus thioreducens]KQH83040.1 hypothetical protein AMR53_02115 [Thermococcus thioreducens]SEV93120.1 hypothetical protein SAMN05216170_0940 [Thermococcus thioreducens]